MQTLQFISSQISQNKLSEAIIMLDEYILAHPDNADAYFMRGKLHWKLGNRSAATNDYAVAADIAPGSAAEAALELAQSIEAFFNPDLLNP